MTGALNVADQMADDLAGAGVDHVFGLLGEDTAEFIVDLVGRHAVEFVGTRHETAAIMAADGYAWATGGIGVASVTRGPGIANCLAAATTAVRAGHGIVIVAGDGASRPGPGGPDNKRAEHAALAAAVGLEHFPARDLDDAVDALRSALSAAERGAASLCTVPVDVLYGPLGSTPEAERRRTPRPEPQAPSAADVESVLAMLARSDRPLILAGRGALEPGTAETLHAIAERSGALLGTTLIAKDLFRGDPYDIGVVGGFASDPARRVLDDIDCLVVFGASLNAFTTAYRNLFQGVPVAQVDCRQEAIGAFFPVALGIEADAGLTAQAILAALPLASSRETPLHAPEVLRTIAGPLHAGEDCSTTTEVDPRLLATTLSEHLPAKASIVADAGHFLTFPGAYMRTSGPGRFRHTSAAGSIGMGIGAALGVAAARSSERTILVVGDGGLLMTLGELETVARYRPNMTIVVMNDGAYGAERHFLDLAGVAHDLAQFPQTDFVGVATALRIPAATVRTLADLRAHADLLSRPGPALLDCKIVGDVRARWMAEVPRHTAGALGSR